MMNNCRFWAVIVAAGNGRRMGTDLPKQYLPLVGKTVIEHAAHALLVSPLIQKVVVVISPQDRYWQYLAISQHPKIMTAIGGAERLDSCLSGLLALQPIAQEHDWVLEHDGARPCLTADGLASLIKQLSAEAVGGLAAYPVSDSMKRSDATQHVLTGIERNNLWHALTPQMFRYGLLRKALTNAKTQAIITTDSASAIELIGYRPKLIHFTKRNIKITEPEDLTLARYFLEQGW